MVFVLLFVTGVAASTAYTVYRMRVEALAQHVAIATVQARAIEDHLTQSLVLLDQTVINASQMNSGEASWSFEGVLRNAPALRSISLLDDKQRIMFSSNPANVGIRVGADDYLPPGPENCDLLRIGRPWSGRDFASGAPIRTLQPADLSASGFIPLLRCVRRGDQVITVAVALNPDYFINYYSARLAGEVGLVDVLRYDGIQLMSTDEQFLPGEQRQDERFLTRISEIESGSFEQVLHGDQTVISAFRASRLFPLVVVLNVWRKHALATWAAESQRLLLMVAPVLLAVLVLATWLYVHLRRVGALQAEARQRDRDRLAATVFTHSREGIVIANADVRIVDVNEAFTRITGYSREDALGKNPRLLSSGQHSREFYVEVWRKLLGEGYWFGEFWNRRKNGELFVSQITISAVRGSRGEIQNFVSLFSDITPMKERQLQLEHIAHHDTLTRLPNRALLADRLRQAMVHSQRRGQLLALVFVDLDGFKAVNDSYGHDVGDVLLITLAERMRIALREGDTLARIGGDEFVVILVDLEQRQDCEPVLERLLQAAAAPVQERKRVLQVSASAGVTFYPQAGVDADQLIHQADQAMYLAKQAGKNCYRIYDEEEFVRA
ncbi:hypothetical protein GCM10027046_10000 [Uliginosibacterium flavum]